MPSCGRRRSIESRSTVEPGNPTGKKAIGMAPRIRSRGKTGWAAAPETRSCEVTLGRSVDGPYNEARAGTHSVPARASVEVIAGLSRWPARS
ncbi:hypothetical protein GCM10009681_46240 [Luedemannella helvata]|uniref:Uncharacterized protein n=1 Tax=Luedemannella helvata TaxID=349315 RepID=A0ABN2KYN9_9ACTN